MDNKNGAVRFRQSARDFPVTVELGGRSPAWGLSRWGNAGALRFTPAHEEGYAIRGDRKQLRYKGRRQEHRFTILHDGAFEYDCILKREPESNTIALNIEGADEYDFFKQPESIRDPFLKGSLAVYRKETLLGQGTGKICHIHRPKILDAAGRETWGDVSAAGNQLLITVPETWLADARYPVVVDPVVGTNTVGALTEYYDTDAGEYTTMYFEECLAVSPFTVPSGMKGVALTAYLYAYNTDYGEICRPVAYTNQNMPKTRCSTSMYTDMIDIAVGNGKSEGWRSATFGINKLTSTEAVWFGIMTDMFYPRFDYGFLFVKSCVDDAHGSIPVSFPNTFAEDYYYRLSMYFDLAAPQQYTRTITQGVTLADTRQRSNGLQRVHTAEMRASETASMIFQYLRRLTESTGGTGAAFLPAMVIRFLREEAGSWDAPGHAGDYLRGIIDNAPAQDAAGHGFFVTRVLAEAAGATGGALRYLTIVLKIITELSAGEFFLTRFLVSREEVKLKSAVCREIIMESKIM